MDDGISPFIRAYETLNYEPEIQRRSEEPEQPKEPRESEERERPKGSFEELAQAFTIVFTVGPPPEISQNETISPPICAELISLREIRFSTIDLFALILLVRPSQTGFLRSVSGDLRSAVTRLRRSAPVGDAGNVGGEQQDTGGELDVWSFTGPGEPLAACAWPGVKCLALGKFCFFVQIYKFRPTGSGLEHELLSMARSDAFEVKPLAAPRQISKRNPFLARRETVVPFPVSPSPLPLKKWKLRKWRS